MNSPLQILARPLHVPPKVFKKAYLFPNTSSLIPIIARGYDANFKTRDPWKNLTALTYKPGKSTPKTASRKNSLPGFTPARMARYSRRCPSGSRLEKNGGKRTL